MDSPTFPEKYAVVQFDGNNNNSTEISVVPSTWLIDTSHCYWPKTSKNLRTMIIKCASPSDDWLTYTCKIVNRYESYYEALEGEKAAVASSESENECRKGKRKLKPKNLSGYEFPEFSDPDGQSDNSIKSFTGSSSSDRQSCQSQINDVNNEPVEDLSHDEADATLTDTLDNAPIVMVNNDYKLLTETVLNVQATVNLILRKVNDLDLCTPRENNLASDEKIKDFIPITGIEVLLNFEEVLVADTEASKQLFNKLNFVGGTDYKNAIKRCLALLFTNKVAMLCSWTGQKNNFKVGDLEMMTVLKRVIIRNFKVTNKDFEITVMEWFRFAKQRHLREGMV